MLDLQIIFDPTYFRPYINWNHHFYTLSLVGLWNGVEITDYTSNNYFYALEFGINGSATPGTGVYFSSIGIKPSFTLQHATYTFWIAYKSAGTWYFKSQIINLDLAVNNLKPMSKSPLIIDRTYSTTQANRKLRVKATVGDIVKIYKANSMQDSAATSTGTFTAASGTYNYGIFAPWVLEPIQTGIVPPYNNNEFEFTNLPAGIYVVSAITDNHSESWCMQEIEVKNTSASDSGDPFPRAVYIALTPTTITRINSTTGVAEIKYLIYYYEKIKTVVNLLSNSSVTHSYVNNNDYTAKTEVWLKEGWNTFFLKDTLTANSSSASVNYWSDAVLVPPIPSTRTTHDFTNDDDAIARRENLLLNTADYYTTGELGTKVFVNNLASDCSVVASKTIYNVLENYAITTNSLGLIISKKALVIDTGTGGSGTTNTGAVVLRDFRFGSTQNRYNPDGTIAGINLDIDEAKLKTMILHDNNWSDFKGYPVKSWMIDVENIERTTPLENFSIPSDFVDFPLLAIMVNYYSSSGQRMLTFQALVSLI